MEDVALPFGELGALAEGSGGAGEGGEVDAVEVAADLGPGGSAGVLGDAGQQEGEPAEDDVGADAFCFSPEAAERDAAVRARMIAQLEDAIRDSGQLGKDKRAELRGVISTKPGLNRYLRVTPGGLLRVDAGKAKAEENLDGKYLLRTSDLRLSAEDIALGYKQLLQVERGWRDLKQVIDLRPVYHRKEEFVGHPAYGMDELRGRPACPCLLAQGP